MALAFTDIDESVLLKAYNLETQDAVTWLEASTEDGAGAEPTTATTAAEGGGAGTEGGKPSSGALATNLAEQSDPLGLRPHLGHVRDLEPAQRSNILLSSKQFDSKLFLSSVHPDATFADLSRGVRFLKQSVEQRSEALKVLVEQNFDRFVAVKATTDGVYREMKQSDHGPLRDDSDYGAKELKELLAAASAKADQVFTPLLENSLKTLKLRSTLGVFERSKFFFNLPGTLSANIEAGRFDVALRDYKKGKFFLESKPGQLFAFNVPAAQAGDPTARGTLRQQEQQQRIFARVWDAVEGNMQQMQSRLFAMLQEPRRSVEDQERTIELLLELNPKEDPVAVFLESQRNHMRSLMKKVFDSASKKMQGHAVQEMIPLDEKDKARNLQACIRILQSHSRNFERMHGYEHWKSIHDLVRSLSEVIRQLMPSFWRIAKDHASGRLERTNGPSSSKLSPNPGSYSGSNASSADRLNAQSRAWAMEALDSYVSILSKFFSLTDAAILGRQALSPIPSWVPRDSCSVSAAHWMRGILLELDEAVRDICALNVGGGSANSSLRSLLNNARFNMTEVLCNLWESDAAIFHMLEDWSLDTDAPSTTLFLRDLAMFQRHNAKEAFLIADGQSSHDGKPREPPIPTEFTGRIKASFLNGLYTFLDGLVQLAFSEYDPLDPTTSTSEKVFADTKVSIDVRELDARILLGVTNIDHLRRTVLPALFKLLSDSLHVQMTEDLKTVEEVAQQLDGILFDDYVKRKSDIISDILREGILKSGINWQTLPNPSEVHPFIYDALLALVQVHAQVRAVAKPLVNRTITALLEQLAEVTYECFSEVPMFGMGGMLQATLGIEFIHQTLAQYVSPSAEQKLNKVYAMVSSKFQRNSATRANNPAEEAELLKVELEAVKKTLSASRRMTALEYLCFRPVKTRTTRKPTS
ncbi:Exocyst complex component S5 [Tilletia horrida]|uniref:Exocyst complex component SEC5 n=1 Tax=Tilletia horrida TaxID=155126 RepID=A0AAN6GU97_9BASI|nr:Exocyst complex component S5 [Tilletia horrida]